MITLLIFILVIFISMVYYSYGGVTHSGGLERKVGFSSKRTERIFDKDTGEILGDKTAKT